MLYFMYLHSRVCLRLPRDTYMYMYMYELAAILWRLSELKPEHMRMKAMDSYDEKDKF